MNQILHLGLGRFHRGHQAVYYQKAGNIRVISSTMRSSEERDKLREVKLRYPVLELSHDSEKITWIDCISDALSLRDDQDKLLGIFTDPLTTIITLTVTEKGYCLDKAGKLDLNHEGIQHDLKNSQTPVTAIGFLAQGLRNRKTKLTIISCDNLRENGKKLESALYAFLENSGADTSWIRSHVTFPNTMVDRIVPALLQEKISELEKQFGLSHSELIATEKFSQWVIEDNFANEKPDWQKVGVQFVSDVRPFEEMKLRLLNASHSYLAYAGLNRGYQFVHEAINDETLHSNVLSMLKNEVIPLLTIPEGFNVDAYVDQLISRFRNNKLPHQLKQIAMDGSQKMPQRIFSSIEEAKKQGRVFQMLMNATDEWINFLWNSRDEKVDDPKASELMKDIDLGKDKWQMTLLENFKL